MVIRRLTVTTCLLALVLAACGSGSLTLTEYAERLESAVAAMNGRIDALDVRLEAAPSVDEARRLWDERIAAREALVEEFEALDPPERAVEMHEAVLDILRRLTAAEAAMGSKATESGDVFDLGEIWSSAEGRAARAIDEEAIGICLAGQAAFDKTTDREILADVPWMSSEMKEVVDVVFGCTPAQRETEP